MISNIEIISASAGSGKTTRLTKELESAIKNGMRPEGILATTFTRKAAAELTERVRHKLLKENMRESALGILDGYVGTVNSVCGRLLKDFAFEAGLSPTQELVPETEELNVFKTAADPVLEKYASDIGPLAYRLAQKDWEDDVRKIISHARTNAITPDGVQQCAEKSWQGLWDIMPEPLPPDREKELDGNLHASIEKALKNLTSGGDGTKTTQNAIDVLLTIQAKVKGDSQLTWQEWARLSKLKTAKASMDAVAPVIEAASYHNIHPRLHRDLEQYIQKIFDCAAQAMADFAEYKRREGLIDYVDQEFLTYLTLKQENVQERLSEFLDIVFVDEFQDTSPIQLAVFLQLAKCVDRSIWIGDQKQAIYGFRGTDPLFMDAAIENLLAGKDVGILQNNWRSRPSLLEFTNHVFTPVFAARGVPEKRVRLSTCKKDHPKQANALEIWKLNAEKVEDQYASIAAGIESLLAQPEKYLVEDPVTRELRPLRGNDIVVFCRRNTTCLKVADALERLGIRVTTRREGLLSTTEAVFAMAALRYLIDPKDTLAAAELLHLSGERDWLVKWLTDTEGKFLKEHPILSALNDSRVMLIDLTPGETMDLAITAANADMFACRWGRAEARLANLDALRGLAKNYEDVCMSRRNAATAAGLVTYLSQEISGGVLDLQGEGVDEHAVNVLTYHKAKGLEWPFVVLSELEWTKEASPFQITLVPKESGFDPVNPLEGRWIRFWPWPYGDQKKDVGLDSRVQGSPEMEQARMAFWSEETRLMYVGMTRARDYMCLAVKDNSKKGIPWLELLRDENNRPVIDIAEAENGIIRCLEMTFPVTIKKPNPKTETGDAHQEKLYGRMPISTTFPEYSPARFRPSMLAKLESDAARVEAPERIGPRIPVVGSPDVNALGESLHSFLAWDDPIRPIHERLTMAKEILQRWQNSGIAPEDLVAASSRLYEYLNDRYGKGMALREHPIYIRFENQVAAGWIDLVWKTADEYIIVDHKSFLGGFDEIRTHCADFVPQLNVYAYCLEAVFGKKPLSLLVHLPFAGAMVKIGEVDVLTRERMKRDE